MINRIKQAYPDPYKARVNQDIINHVGDRPLWKFIVNCFASIHNTLDEITLLDYEFNTDVERVSQSDYERTRSNRAADKEQKYTYTEQSYLGELTMYFQVDLRNSPIKTKQEFLRYTVRELIPIEIDGCYILGGTKYPIQYQLTERTTYVTPGALVSKALMGINLSKEKVVARDHRDVMYTMNGWRVNMFNGTANAAYFFLEDMGWNKFLQFFRLETIMNVTTEEDRDPQYTYFKIDPPLYLKVKEKFVTHPYVSSMIGTILAAMPNHITLEEVYDRNTWLARIGATKKSSPKESHMELGARYRKLFNRMLDDSSIEEYELTDYNKKDILHIIRWMIQENGPLRAKDNMDIMNKRLRRAEVIGSLVNGIISEKIKRFINTTVKTEERLIDQYNNLFSYKGTEVISKVHRSGLAKWDDAVNDLDLFNRFKVTLTGPNAIGNKNPRNISAKQKSLDVSQIGILGLDICGSSNPGMSNYLNLFCETEGLRFKGRPAEPEEFGLHWKDILNEDAGIIPDEGTTPVIQVTSPTGYNNLRDFVMEGITFVRR